MKVLVFGVFDTLHPGHIYFLQESSILGDELHICLASDEYVQNYKHKNPIHSFTLRSQMIKDKFPNVVVHKGDVEIGNWSIFNEIIPDVIALGYDQEKLHMALIDLILVQENTKIVHIKPFQTDIYNTTKMNANK